MSSIATKRLNILWQLWKKGNYCGRNSSTRKFPGSFHIPEWWTWEVSGKFSQIPSDKRRSTEPAKDGRTFSKKFSNAFSTWTFKLKLFWDSLRNLLKASGDNFSSSRTMNFQVTSSWNSSWKPQFEACDRDVRGELWKFPLYDFSTWIQLENTVVPEACFD